MRTYHFKGVVYYESKAFFDADYRVEQRQVESTVFDFTKRYGFRRIIEAYKRVSGLDGYILLHAHGCRKNQAWTFADGERRHRIQDFIDRHDGDALAILLQCCNPHKKEIRSKKSLVIHAKHNLNFFDLIRGGHLRMFIPELSYLEDRKYALTEAIEKLEER